MTNWKPNQGSGAAKLIAHLQTAGEARVDSVRAGQIMGVLPKQVLACLRAALEHGVIVKTLVQGRAYFSLASAPAHAAAVASHEMVGRLPRPVPAAEPAPVSAPPDPPAPARKKLDVVFGFWSDGDFVIRRGDEVMTLDEHEFGAMLGYLTVLRHGLPVGEGDRDAR